MACGAIGGMWWGVSGALHVGLPGGLALGPTSDVV